MEKLIKYAERFIASRPELATASGPEKAAAFATKLRAGCHQDILRLIEKIIGDTSDYTDGKRALRALSKSLTHGHVELWGMPDCTCKKSDCVYCALALPEATKEEK